MSYPKCLECNVLLKSHVAKRCRKCCFQTPEFKEKMKQYAIKNGNTPPPNNGTRKIGWKFSKETSEARSKQLKAEYASGSRVAFFKGKHHSEETKKKLSRALKGRKLSTETRRKIADSKRGSKSHFWKGGKTAKMKQIKKGSEWRMWRETVFERDNWTCQDCGERGGILHPHHIKKVCQFPELIFEVSNGVTLCKICHKKTDSYGKRITKQPRNSKGRFTQLLT